MKTLFLKVGLANIRKNHYLWTKIEYEGRNSLWTEILNLLEGQNGSLNGREEKSLWAYVRGTDQ